MTEQERLDAVDGILYLLRSIFTDTVPDRQIIDQLNLANIYAVATQHKVGAAVGIALENAGVRNEKFVMAVAMSQRRTALLEADRNAVQEGLEEAGIWYMPLKGALLKDYYPRYGMREMVDIDILYDRRCQKEVRQIMERVGFTVKSYDKMHDDDYQKPPVSYFEMHTSLFDHRVIPSMYEYYKNVKERLHPVPETKSRFQFTDEDFYLYMIAHEYEHYVARGTGLRSIIDTWVFLHAKTLDMDYVVAEAQKIGIAEFERQNRILSEKIMAGETLSEQEQEMLEYMSESGVFGNIKNKVINRIEEHGRSAYLLSRLTPPYEFMLELYPILRKYPVLYPFVWIYRLVTKVFTQHKRFTTELKVAMKADSTEKRRQGEKD